MPNPVAPTDAAPTTSTPADAIGDPLAIAPATPLADPAAITGVMPTLGTRTAKALLLYDGTNAEFAIAMGAFAQSALGGAEARAVSSHDELLATLREYATIERLVLFFHGSGASILFTVNHVETDKRLETIASELGTVAPQVTVGVELEGCNAGIDPDQLATFGAVFKTPKTSGWNYYHVVQRKTLTIPQGTTEASVVASLPYAAEYQAPGFPTTASLAASSGSVTVVYEWFRNVYDPTPPGGNTVEKDLVARSDAGISRISASDTTGLAVLETALNNVVARLTLAEVTWP